MVAAMVVDGSQKSPTRSGKSRRGSTIARRASANVSCRPSGDRADSTLSEDQLAKVRAEARQVYAPSDNESEEELDAAAAAAGAEEEAATQNDAPTLPPKLLQKIRECARGYGGVSALRASAGLALRAAAQARPRAFVTSRNYTPQN